ncbi:E3 ubiquitin-protein ligase At3g02290-like [Phoenix dactylifera]|uniref:RING-type E3 ubiquitin transferase n=1 Tax=Phoenix dactylifera TaxID=42345 RepID=A0A8B9AWP8_PHODC|nr:E3 ubiquitin-protein ligase At3g02290-like [Phoenix dactylifera]XP_038990032.1 E3 ubiquitin-protein ligase At3g02290-like [Phoenix dactylifera]
MGSVCSCFHIGDFEDYAHANASICTHCICFSCLTQQLIHVYTALFQRGEVRAIPSSVEGTAPLASAALVTDDFIPDTYRPPPRPLPYDDPRCSRLQRDGLVSRRDKSLSHFHEESEPLRRNSSYTEMETMSRVDKCGSDYDRGSKLCDSESLLKHPLTEDTKGATYFFPSSEDEDVCPTCLEEYTSENPRIIMQCTHHFHLSCIYEWMERSDACPICGKMMVFNETA